MTATEKAVCKFVRKFPKEDREGLAENILTSLNGKQVMKGENTTRLQEILDEIDKFLSNHDGTYQGDARALWHIIGGATRGPDDEAPDAKAVTVNLRALAFPRTAQLGTGTGASFTYNPKVPQVVGKLGHFRQHAAKAIEGLRRAGRIKAKNGQLIPNLPTMEGK